MIKLNRRHFTASLIGSIIEAAPGRKPRKLDKIINHIIEALNKEDKRNPFKPTKSPTEFQIGNCKDFDAVLDTVKYALDCDEIRELNVSNNDYKKGVKYGDQEGVMIVTATSPEPNVDDDFVDLDALYRNAANDAIIYERNREDCMFCLYEKSYGSFTPGDNDKCRTCNINPNYNFNYVTHPLATVPRNSPEYLKLCKKYNVNPKDWEL